MILPEQFSATSPADLLREAAYGRIGLDQRLIRTLLDRPEETLDALEAQIANPVEDRVLNLDEVYLDLYRALGSPRAIPFYLGQLRESIEDIPDELIEAFAALGDAGLDAVLALHAELPEEEAADVAFLLAAMGVHDERVRNVLRETLSRDPFEAALAIGLLGDPALRPDVEAALAALPADAKEERANLQDCLRSLSEPIERETAEFDVLSLYPATSAPVLEVMEPGDLLPYLTCASSEYRAAAARVLADEPDFPEDVRDALIDRAFNDESLEVRGEALRALGICRDDEQVRPRLLDAALDQQAPLEVRAGALIALAPAAGDTELQPALMAFYEHEATRAAALEAMWHSLDARYRKYIAANLRSEDDEILLQAVQGVGAIPLPDLAIELVPLFNSELREEALISYALAVNAPITPKSVSKLFDRIEEKAGGMTEEESEVVAQALDSRLVQEGFRPVFYPDDEDEDGHDHHHHHHGGNEPARSEKVGRNDPCPCGSGKKFKKCCGA